MTRITETYLFKNGDMLIHKWGDPYIHCFSMVYGLQSLAEMFKNEGK